MLANQTVSFLSLVCVILILTVVGKVKVQALVEGESSGVVVEGDIDLTNGAGKNVALETSEDFLNVSDADCAASRALEGVVSGKAEVDTVFISLPLLVGEEIAELGVP